MKMKIYGDLCMNALSAMYGRVRNYDWWNKSKDDGYIAVMFRPCQAKPMQAKEFYGTELPTGTVSDQDGWRIIWENGDTEWVTATHYNSYFSPLSLSFK